MVAIVLFFVLLFTSCPPLTDTTNEPASDRHNVRFLQLGSAPARSTRPSCGVDSSAPTLRNSSGPIGTRIALLLPPAIRLRSAGAPFHASIYRRDSRIDTHADSGTARISSILRPQQGPAQAVRLRSAHDRPFPGSFLRR